MLRRQRDKNSSTSSSARRVQRVLRPAQMTFWRNKSQILSIHVGSSTVIRGASDVCRLSQELEEWQTIKDEKLARLGNQKDSGRFLEIVPLIFNILNNIKHPLGNHGGM